jgi:predicted SAM-dependent methyltransferase
MSEPRKKLLDRIYKHIRPLRPLWGWAVDARSRARSSARTKEWEAKGFVGAKLDVCGGRNPFKPGEFLNVDVVPFPQVDLCFDIRRRFPIPDAVIAEIISLATLEHLRQPTVHHVLREFFRVLQPGGTLRVSTPDIEAIARSVLAGDAPETWNQHLFGRYKSEETEDTDLHRWMYTADQMASVLRDIGFGSVTRIPMDLGFHDPAYTYLLRAVKPA